MSTLQRFQNWYAQNCNGDWEHDFGITIETLDNPGWLIKIDLQLMAFQDVIFNLSERKSELDWYEIIVKDWKFIAYCDASKLEFIINYFLDEFVPKFEDKGFEYEVLLPLEGIDATIWLTNCIAKKVNKNTFQIVSIPNSIGNNILTETFDVIENNAHDFDKLQLMDKVGDLIQTTLVSTFQGTRLAKKVKIKF